MIFQTAIFSTEYLNFLWQTALLSCTWPDEEWQYPAPAGSMCSYSAFWSPGVCRTSHSCATAAEFYEFPCWASPTVILYFSQMVKAVLDCITSTVDLLSAVVNKETPNRRRLIYSVSCISASKCRIVRCHGSFTSDETC